jgi:hypothetical protein
MVIGDEDFLDGAMGAANNPIDQIMNEARDVWGAGDSSWVLEDNIACLVSIGTGIPSLNSFSGNIVDIGKALVKVALDTEQRAETFQKQHTRLFQEKRAFRFNVVKGVQRTLGNGFVGLP